MTGCPVQQASLIDLEAAVLAAVAPLTLLAMGFSQRNLFYLPVTYPAWTNCG